MYNTELVRQICHELSSESDPATAEELISLLRAVVLDDQEEVRMRMKFLAQRYARFFSDSESKAAD